MNVIAIVMACGRSARFQLNGLPKQFVEFGSPPQQMYRNVVEGLDCRRKLLMTLNEYEALVRVPCDQTWVTMTCESSAGQAETAMKALSHVNHSESFDGYLFVNCDNGFAPGVLDRLVYNCGEWNWPGALTMQVHSDEENRWSFVDGHPRFYNVYEKKCVHMVGQAPRALAGAYYVPANWLAHFDDTLARVVHSSRTRRVEPQMSAVLTMLNAPLLSVDMKRDEFYDWGTVQSFHQWMGSK